jgi:hypothetical protein
MEISEQNSVFWKKVCERVKELIEEDNIKEEVFHRVFETQLKNSLKWPPNHLKHEISVQIGRETKRADTIMEGDGFGIIIEMKTPIAVLGENDREQLISYMTAYHTARNDIRCKYGLLIGKEIEVYFRSEPDKKPRLVARFGFDVNSSDGNSLGKILMYDKCSEEKLDKFMNEPHDIKRHEIKQPPKPLKTPKTGNNEGNKVYDERTTDALREIKEIAQFFIDNGYQMKQRNTPWGNQIYTGCRIIGNTNAMGAFFVISIFPKKTPDERYRFKYETKHSTHHEFEEKQRRIFGRFGISEFESGENDIGRIIFRINDPRNEILDIIARTREIMGF